MSDCCVAGTLHAHQVGKTRHCDDNSCFIITAMPFLQPTGAEEAVSGRPAYICRPSDPAVHAVILATDVFGYALPNIRAIADKFAAAGFLAVVPDLLDGDSLPVDALNKGITPAFGEWLARHDNAPHIQGMLADVAAELREKHGIKRIAIKGYCWGGKFAVLAAATPIVDAFAAAHPSRLDIPVSVEAVTRPGIFLLAETDRHICGEVEAALVAAATTVTSRGVEVEVRKWPGTTHGFAVRGGDDDPVVATARREAFEVAVEFFRRTFA